MNLERVVERLRMSFPRARFFQVGAVGAGQLDSEAEEKEFNLVSLYEHSLTNSFVSIRGHHFIISNGFLASHVYNLALVCILFEPGDIRFGERWLENALRHNLKKFFAECCLGERNCLFGRAFLIETLSFEQGLMDRVFKRVREDGALGSLAGEIAGAMTRMLSLHEMSHYMIRRSGRDLVEEIESLSGISLGKSLARIAETHGAGMAEEVQCDLCAVIFLVYGDGGDLREFDRSDKLRIAAFHFDTFGHLDALFRSAVATAQTSEIQDATVAFGSEMRSKEDLEYVLGRSPGMDFRRTTIFQILEQLAAKEGFELHGSSSRFRFEGHLSERLQKSWESCLDEFEPLGDDLTGTNRGRRGIARLLAESLHGHDEGAEHLLWRSKQFSIGGNPIDP